MRTNSEPGLGPLPPRRVFIALPGGIGRISNRLLHAATILLSAFLLFMIQLVMGKVILPWFGGTSSVWTTCMLFFQLVLLAGYAYTHLTTRWLRPRAQAVLQRTLVVVALAALGLAVWRWGDPIIPGEAWKPQATDHPQGAILALLLVSIGLPFFLLSTTGPMLQRWFSLRGKGERTYRLYAVSNLGSVLGLVSYPFLVERWLPLSAQTAGWAAGFGLFGLGLWLAARDLPDAAGPAATTPRPIPVPRWRILAWFMLAMGASSLLLSVTNELCQEVASVPFLWMLPLVLYLATFIISFDHPRWYQRRPLLVLSAVLTVICMITASLGVELGLVPHILSFSAFLFCLCLTCHGELAALKPPPAQLTLYFLVIAAGGAAGGLFVALGAPLLFKSYWEFNVMTAAIWILLGLLLWRDRRSVLHTGDWWHALLLVWLMAYLGTRLALGRGFLADLAWVQALPLAGPALIGLGVAGLLVIPWRRRAWTRSKSWPRVTIVAVIFLAESFMMLRVSGSGNQVVEAERNFFGALKILLMPSPDGVNPPVLQLVHGQINHGFQVQDAVLGRLPASYYGPGTGIEKAMVHHPRRQAGQPLRIGVLGLGVGTLAAYAEPGDVVRFYEINPAVIRYCTGERPYFTYLRDCRGEVEVIPGDARLSLEREPPQQFDLLVMDAFSSDSVPVHLLTREAFALYQRHLRDEDSLLLVNISNRFLDFRDLVATQADDLSLVPIFAPTQTRSAQTTGVAWMILTRSRAFIAKEAVRTDTLPWVPRRRIRWTDDYSNLFDLLLERRRPPAPP